MSKIRAALIGLSGVGQDYLAALQGEEEVELIAVADTSSENLRRHVTGTSLLAYEDCRSLIVENAHAGLDLLFVALEPFQSIEFAELAASRGIDVFHKAPFARSVEEARRITTCFDANHRRLIVSRYWQYEPAFSDLANISELIGRVYAASVAVRTSDIPHGWRGDHERAGGGVLLNGAYEQLDLLVSLLGVPESVYAQCAFAGAPGVLRKYDTEDAATLLLRFKGDRTATLSAWRGATDAGWTVTLVGATGTVEVCESGMTLRRPGKEPSIRRVVDASKPIAAAVHAMGTSRTSPNRPPPAEARDHLKTLGVIAAAYLSAKTGSPETPARFLA